MDTSIKASVRASHGGRPAVTICGGGNGGHALAVVASQHFDGDIDWLVGSEEKAELLRRGVSDGLQSTGAIRASADRVRTISSDPGRVIPNADMVLIVVPAFVHAMVLRRIAPYVSDRTIIGCFPTRGGFEFEAAQLVPRDGTGRRRVFGLQTLPWSTRVVTPGSVVNIGAVKAEVVLAALPATDAPGIAARLSEILGTRVLATEGFLSLTLGNTGQVIHPGLMYGHLRSWRGDQYDKQSIPMFYAHATDDMGRIVERLSNEAVEVARAIEAQAGGAIDLRAVMPVHDWLKVSYSHVTDDVSTVATCLRTGPIQARQIPTMEIRPGRFVPNFQYRYMTEDVPFGLVISRAFAELVNVETPTMDEVIRWAQSVMRRTYLIDGRLDGPDARDLPTPQRHGISSIADLIEWYGAVASTPSRIPARPS